MSKTILLLFLALLTSCSADNVLCDKVPLARAITTSTGTTYLVSNTESPDMIVLIRCTATDVAE